MKEILKNKGFVAFLFIAFLNASVDLGHKITIQNVLLKTFDGQTLFVLTAVVNAMILLPFIFLFSPAGFISDRFSKIKVIQTAALVGVGLTIVISVSYFFGWFKLAFFMTFLLAIQSAIYSPAKYAIIKKLVGTEQLGVANGIVQALTIVAILLSSFAFSFVFEMLYGGYTQASQILPQIFFVGIILVILSSLEAFSAFKLPQIKEEQDEGASFDYKKYLRLDYLKQNIKLVMRDENIWLSIFALSVFWGVSQVVIASFPVHFKTITGSDNAIAVNAILAVSMIGLVFGAMIAGAMSKHHIELGIIPLGGAGMFASLFLFGVATDPFMMGLASLGFGFSGGIFIVPLNATIQYFAPEKDMGRILAGNNFAQNIFMVSFLFVSILFVHFAISTRGLFLLMAIISLLASIYAVMKLPHLFARILLLPILKTSYHFNVEGIKNLPQSGGVLLVGNHISWIDWLVLQVASPRAIKFVMDRKIYKQWYINWFLKFFNVIPIGVGASKESIAAIAKRLENGEVVAIFGEGHISYNGQINTFAKGFEMAMKDLDCPIVPFYLRGLWGSSFSRASKHYKSLTQKRGKRDIIVAFGKPMASNSNATEVRQGVVELSYWAWEVFLNRQDPIMHHWLLAAKANLFKTSTSDTISGTLSNAKFITAVLIFIELFKEEFSSQKRVGVALPSSTIAAIINMALFSMGKIPINLNYTLSKEAMAQAIKKADIKAVISSANFIQKLKAKGFDYDELLGDKLILVETLSKKITKKQKICSALLAYLAPKWLIKTMYFAKVDITDTATILFSSGSEGEPKGIELTHKNLLANIKQTSDLLNFQKTDVILNSLPIFHSFGLTVTTLLPLCEGVKMVSVPDPTDAQAVGKAVAKNSASILFATSTFLRLYARNKKVTPLMFASLRLVVAGAEKLKQEVKESFKLKFGKEIYEGYGTTETAPVVSVNMPNVLDPQSLREFTFNKKGSVGMALPATIVKIVDPDTLKELPIGEDGLIVIGGAQTMKGYLDDEEKTNEVIATIDDTRYYKTGDKGHIDENGFVFIVDRYSRFAKIGGEMVSLGKVEEEIAKVLDLDFIAVNVADEKKGEAVVLLVKTDEDTQKIKQDLQECSLAPIMQPSYIFALETLPVLASGKADFKSAKSLAQELVTK